MYSKIHRFAGLVDGGANSHPRVACQYRALGGTANGKTVALLYGITDAELAQLLRSFKGLASKRLEYVALLH